MFNRSSGVENAKHKVLHYAYSQDEGFCVEIDGYYATDSIDTSKKLARLLISMHCLPRYL